MHVFRRLVFTAVLAGLLAGGVAALAQHGGVIPIIARAEVYEAASAHAAHASGDHDAAPSAAWAPSPGFERSAFTTLADIVTATAFSLLLAAALQLWGGPVTLRTGLLWGLAGFATFTLAPGLGLPPELPGSAASPLLGRQVWWAATAAATAGGLALLLLQRRPLWMAAGVILLLAPHIVGAPAPTEPGGSAPAALAREFVLAAVATSLLFWLVLGGATGLVYRFLSRPSGRSQQPGAVRAGS